MFATDTGRTRLAPEIAELGLEEYVLQLEVDGLAVIPPEVHGVSEERIDELADSSSGEPKRSSAARSISMTDRRPRSSSRCRTTFSPSSQARRLTASRLSS